MKLLDFSFEQSYRSKGHSSIVGIDEAGRGPLAGPVVAAAVVYKHREFTDCNQKEWTFVRDSKTLSQKQREAVIDFIHEHFFVGIGECSPGTIDAINVLEATFLSMKKALSEVNNYLDEKSILLVDGHLPIPNLSRQQSCIRKGDSLVRSIAAASIIAKVSRDRLMDQAHELYPMYYFDEHKGYGTKKHMEALRVHGPSPIHRTSFRPVRDLINSNHQ